MEHWTQNRSVYNTMKIKPDLNLSRFLFFTPIFRYEQLPSYEKDGGSDSMSPLVTTIFGRRIDLPCSSPGSYCSRLLRRPCSRQQRLLRYLIAVTGAITLICLIGLGINGNSPFYGKRLDYYWQRFPRYVEIVAPCNYFLIISVN